MRKEPFEGRSAQMKKESAWLASEDLEGLGDVVLTIEGVFKNEDVSLEGGKKEKVLYSIKYEKSPKEMLLNATNRQRIKNMYGPNVKDWKGKPITLFVDPNCRLVGGGTGNGLRVRPEKPTAKNATKNLEK